MRRAAQELLPKHLHATGLAIYLAICTLFGTLGPIIVGVMQDSFGYSLRSVLALMLAANYFSAGVLLLVLAYLHRDGPLPSRPHFVAQPPLLNFCRGG